MSAGLLDDPGHIRADAALIRQGLAGKWDIPEAQRKELMQKLLAAVLDPKIKTRALNSLTKTIAMLDRVALAAEIGLRDNKPQVVVVNNNTNNVDTLSQVMANFKDPGDAQKFLELLGKSGYQPANNADASKSTEADSGSSGRS